MATENLLQPKKMHVQLVRIHCKALQVSASYSETLFPVLTLMIMAIMATAYDCPFSLNRAYLLVSCLLP